MSIFALSDLHLAFSTPEKTMEIFGDQWKSYPEKIADNWQKTIKKNDLVLIAGDISWAMKLEEAKKDLEWIHKLNGTKVIIKGNHDYWWSSYSKVQSILPPSIVALQNTIYTFVNFSIGGTRLWDTDEIQFNAYNESPPPPIDPTQKEMQKKIYERELIRLELSLKELDTQKTKIVMTHYPPIGANGEPSKASSLIEKYQVHTAVFGHLHDFKSSKEVFGLHNHVRYCLTSADYLNFNPLQLF
jgi:predicted phosphohydrolase